MSENAEAVKGCNAAGEGEEESMQHDGLNEGGKRALNAHSSNFVNPDDELLSWLQYPIDDDILHHLPPPLTAFPAPHTSADVFTPSSSAFGFSSSLICPSRAIKHLPQLENEAFKDTDRRLGVDDWFLRKEEVESEFSEGEQSILLKNQGVASGQEGSVGVRQHHVEDYHLENRLSRGGGGRRISAVWASRLLDPKLGSIKDRRQLAPLNCTSEEERDQACTAGEGVSKDAPHLMHSSSGKASSLYRDQDTNMMMLTSQPLQSKGERGFHEAVRENVLPCAQPASNQDAWLQKDMDMILDSKEGGTHIIGKPEAHSHVDAALALGAGRAAGIIKTPSMEAFSKVRTSLQPTQPVLLGSTSKPSNFLSSKNFSGKSTFPAASGDWMMAPTLRPLRSSYGSMPTSPFSSQNSPSPNPVHCHVPNSSAGFLNVNSPENQLDSKEKNKSFKRNITQISPPEFLPTASLRPQEVLPPLAGSLKKFAPESFMAGGSHSINIAAAAASTASEHETTDAQKLSSVSFLSQERPMAGTCSGGSQTSGRSLSETASGIKRKMDDSECQSEEADEDSVVSSQARTPTPKRPRANEVHNLSERRRRNKINDKMNALRDLIPNASKSNKAALLDEAIDYLKNLQLHLQVMSSRTGVSLLPMALPPSMPHMPMPQYGSLGAVGMDVCGGSAVASTVSPMGMSTHKMYAGHAAQPFRTVGSGSLPLMCPRPFQPLAARPVFSQFQSPPAQPSHAHAHGQSSPQINFPTSLHMYNNQHIEQQQQLQQLLPPDTSQQRQKHG